MNKIKSQALYAFLKERDLLESQDLIAIEQAKREYRRIYKRNWKAARRKTKAEIRFSIKKQDFNALDDLCKEGHNQNTSPTQIARDLLLEFLSGNGSVIESKGLNHFARNLGLIINRHVQSSACTSLVQELITLEREILQILKA
jgi:hypothetical protein